MSDDSEDVYMSTLATLNNPITDEYDQIIQDRIVWDHSSFTDISTWEIYQPSDENVRVHHPHSPDLQKGSTIYEKDDVMLAVQRYSILNRVEYRIRKSDSTKLVLECRKGEEVCLWHLRVVVMQRTSYWTVRKYRGDHICHNNSILQSNIHLNAHFIAREMWNVTNAKTRFSTGQIRNLIQRDYEYEINYWKA
ncbi:hypothetical protein QQ045_004439 [Rhodiola kirilowii]